MRERVKRERAAKGVYGAKVGEVQDALLYLAQFGKLRQKADGRLQRLA